MNRQEFANSCRVQAAWCEKLGSPLYQAILLKIADDVLGAGRCWPAIEPSTSDAGRSLLPLRFLARVHRMVLTGQLPELARYYPSAGGVADLVNAPEVFLEVAESHAIAIPDRVQTNEISRCCALLPGFLAIANRARLPMRLLEIGCSAGLNLRWDCYCYETPRGAWGYAKSTVRFANVYSGGEFEIGAKVDTAARGGCDLNPIDPTMPDGRLDLLSFVWPDQAERFRLLDHAIEIAHLVPADIETADAAAWLESKLAARAEGVVSVVFHSIVMMYLTPDQRARVAEIIRQAGERADSNSPLAWLRMENGGEETEVTLEYWPGGERIKIADAGFHGRNVRIL